MGKDLFVNAVMLDMENDLEVAQLQKLKTVLVLRLRDYDMEKQSREIALYDPEGDLAMYKQYFVSKKIQGLSDGTLKQYKYAVDRFMRTVRKPFREVTTNDIRLYIADRSMNDGICNASLRRERGAICRFFQWLYDEEFIGKNPGARVEMIQVEKRLKEPFSEIELEQLRANCRTNKEKAVIELLMSTGCRVSELCSLVFEKLDRINGGISVIGKGNKERTVYINARAQIALLAYSYSNGHYEGPLIQGRRRGEKMTPSGIQKIVRKIGDRAGISNVHPHRFRRTAATLARKRGMSLEMIRLFMGHESVDTTLLYAIVSDEELAHDHKKFIN